MKITESRISETLEMDNPLCCQSDVILDNGYGDYTHKIIIAYYGKDNHSRFRIMFNPESMSIKLHNAFLQAGIDPYNINLRNVPNETDNFELIKCVYYDFDKETDKEKYNGIKDYVNSIKRHDNYDIKTIYGIKINKGEYSANRGTFSVKVSGGYYHTTNIMMKNI